MFCHDELVIRVALQDFQTSGMDDRTFRWMKAELQAVLRKELGLRKLVQQVFPSVAAEEDNPWDSTTAMVKKRVNEDDEAIRCHSCHSYVYLSYVVCGKGDKCPEQRATAAEMAAKKEDSNGVEVEEKESKHRYGNGRIGLDDADRAAQRKVCLSCIDKVSLANALDCLLEGKRRLTTFLLPALRMSTTSFAHVPLQPADCCSVEKVWLLNDLQVFIAADAILLRWRAYSQDSSRAEFCALKTLSVLLGPFSFS